MIPYSSILVAQLQRSLKSYSCSNRARIVSYTSSCSTTRFNPIHFREILSSTLSTPSTPDASVFLRLENGLHFPILKIFLFRESIYSEMEQHETKSIYRRAEFRILWFTSGDIIGETTLGIDARSTSTIVLIHPAEIGNIWTIVEPLFLSSIVITIQRGDKKQRLFVNNHESRI